MLFAIDSECSEVLFYLLNKHFLCDSFHELQGDRYIRLKMNRGTIILKVSD